MRRSNLVSSPAKLRLVKQQFANPDDYLSYELGKAVQELPPLYTRLLAATISLLVFGAIAWAALSKVDEVAIAPGELIPSTQVRPLRSLNGGTIRAIRVKEGEHVYKGEVLLKLDPDLQQAQFDRLAKSRALIQEDLGRLEAERQGAATTGTKLQDQLLTSRLQDFEARRAAALAEAGRQAAALNEARVRLNRLQDNLTNAKTDLANAKINLVNAQRILVNTKSTLANAQTREQGLSILSGNGATPRLDYLDAQAKVIQSKGEVTKSEDGITNAQDKVTQTNDKVTSLEKDIAAQTQEIRQAEQAYQVAHNQEARLEPERQSDILTQLNKRREEQTTIEGQLEQARLQREQETISAPVAGTIYSIKATKGPVQSGEELLSIVPEASDLLLEVKVLNRDIGFIHQGMKAKVKMATFPFQEFGTIDGTVVQVSPNAIVDQQLGLVFPTRIKLNQHLIKVRGQDVELTPGMSASAEIVTRKKSILTFLIEPITRRFSEAFSVR